MFPDDVLDFSAMGNVDTVQWRSNHLRDDWSNIHSFDHGDSSGTLTAIDIIHQLEHLPGIDLEGNHTISLRGIKANDSGGHTSSPLISANIMLMDTGSAFDTTSKDAGVLPFLSAASMVAVIVLAGVVSGSRRDENQDEK